MTITIQNYQSQCDTHNLYEVNFFEDIIHTLVTHDPNMVSQWLSVIESLNNHSSSRLVVSLDIEWHPNNRYYKNPVATLQLCVGLHCLIYQLIHSPYVSSPLVLPFSPPASAWNNQFEPTWKVSTFIPSGSSLHLPNDCILENGSVFPFYPHYRLVSIGRKIYIIGRTAMLRYDTWTGTLVPKARMGFPRKKFAAAEVAGKIYVAGGSSRPEAVEEYDPDENEWRVVSHAPRRRYGCIGAAVDGVFYVIGGLKIGAAGNEAAHVYASSMDLYDVEARGWLRSRALPGGGCVVAACAANGHLYILSSHAVELSFWKFNGSRKSREFGEWRRIKPPPLPAQVRLDSTVGFSCVGVGDKVVLIQVVGCIDDLLRRSGRRERGLKEGLVLIYDCATEEWSRAADTPAVIRRAACVCVEC
ncbi:F-box/kelch-repeat protein [Forsythia ovata]|uniref:F-box/kelch-repeat protein n=1 Tax=Forsythia ovata TaxID=205694 RepID=A0ABD1T3Y4_9LAMI